MNTRTKIKASLRGCFYFGFRKERTRTEQMHLALLCTGEACNVFSRNVYKIIYYFSAGCAIMCKIG